MPNTEAVLPFTSMSRRCNLRMVGGGEVCARAASGDAARAAAPPARIARLDNMGSLLDVSPTAWRRRRYDLRHNAQGVYHGFFRRRAMAPSDDVAHVDHERRLQRLIRRLPGKMQAVTRWLRRPASRWARIPAGVLLIIGGCL